jgi:hypothetical protein
MVTTLKKSDNSIPGEGGSCRMETNINRWTTPWPKLFGKEMTGTDVTTRKLPWVRTSVQMLGLEIKIFDSMNIQRLISNDQICYKLSDSKDWLEMKRLLNFAVVTPGTICYCIIKPYELQNKLLFALFGYVKHHQGYDVSVLELDSRVLGTDRERGNGNECH